MYKVEDLGVSNTSRDEYFYIMQVLKGATIAHGPYRTRQGRDNAMETRVSGGEVFPFKCYTDDPVKAIQEFNSRGVR